MKEENGEKKSREKAGALVNCRKRNRNRREIELTVNPGELSVIQSGNVANFVEVLGTFYNHSGSKKLLSYYSEISRK